MNYFIFQAIDKNYLLLSELFPGATVQWTASRYRARMQIGDVVFLWRGGPPSIRGIYGWGNISGTPYARDTDGEFRVAVTYKVRLENPILVDEIKKNTRLQNMQILNIPIGTNFQINISEAIELCKYFRYVDAPNVGVN